MYEFSKSAVLLDGERLVAFDVEQGVAQGCTNFVFRVYHWIVERCRGS